jgi:hypothetical protein
MPTNEMKDPLYVGVSAWIIQDGNYPDFTVGQATKFALEFSPFDGLNASVDESLFAEHLGASRYRIRAKVLYATPNVWVIDTGTFLAFDEQQPPPYALPGANVQGDIYLGIDPYFYFEYLHTLEAMPKLSCSWQVLGIQREATPWVHERDNSGRTTVLRRDDQSEAFVDVSATDAWKDDGGNAHYVLSCCPWLTHRAH